MNFVNNTIENPNVRPIGYYVINADDTISAEYYESEEGPDTKELNFKDVNKVGAKEIGLIGNGKRIQISTDDGIIKIFNGTDIFNIEMYMDYDKSHNPILITGRDDKPYSDIIQYKHFYNDLSIANKNFSGITIDKFCVGYKYTIIDKDKELSIRILFRYSIIGTSEIEIRISSKFNIDGYFFTIVNGDMIKPSKLNIEAGNSCTLIKTVTI
jgi:hypothetical protein